MPSIISTIVKQGSICVKYSKGSVVNHQIIIYVKLVFNQVLIMMSTLYYIVYQYAQLNIHSASSQSAGRHVLPLERIIPVPSQSVFALSPQCCMLSRGATNTNLIVFGLTRPGIATTFQASTLTITPTMQFPILEASTLNTKQNLL